MITTVTSKKYRNCGYASPPFAPFSFKRGRLAQRRNQYFWLVVARSPAAKDAIVVASSSP